MASRVFGPDDIITPDCAVAWLLGAGKSSCAQAQNDRAAAAASPAMPESRVVLNVMAWLLCDDLCLHIRAPVLQGWHRFAASLHKRAARRLRSLRNGIAGVDGSVNGPV
jgi:hypothetical protein